MARLKIGHTRLTHEHRLKGVAEPMCQECNAILTVEHILLNCKKFENSRKNPQCVNCKGEHPSFSKKCPKFLEEKEIQSIRIRRKIPFSEARKIVRASHPPMPAQSYAAAVTAKRDVECQTPSWPQQAVKPQTKEGKSKQPSKGPIRAGPPKEGKTKQPSKGPSPPGPSPGRSGPSSGIPVLSGTTPPQTSGGSTKPSTPGAREHSFDKAPENRQSVPVAESSYAGKAASPPRPKPVTLRRNGPCLLTVKNRFAALSEPSMTVLKKQAQKIK